ncbi:endoglucanase [Marinilabiliaceae bacterium JC017]|nr:endoglucanase [Marinilabiliaceae bacterium JC017]
MRIKGKISGFLIALTGLLCYQCTENKEALKTRFVTAADQAFLYMGRVDKQGDQVAYNWPGIMVSTRFTGRSLGIRIKGEERNYFNVWVDDCPEQVVHAVNDTVWWFPGRLSAGEHQLRLVKRTEADMGMATFYGLHIGEKDSLMAPLPLPERKVLFIGNSITCGYGTEGKNKLERFHPSTENCEKSYATIIARAFKAQYQLVSHSGLGIVRNYGDPEKISRKLQPMPARLDYLFDGDSTKRYDLNKYIPDAVVINLGTNDYSTQPFPDEKDYVKGGMALLERITTTFPGVRVFCIAGPMINEPCYSYNKKIVELYREQYSNKDVAFIGVPVELLNPEKDLGSDWHPSYRGQVKSAFHIIPVISTVMNWDYSSEEERQVLISQ